MSKFNMESVMSKYENGKRIVCDAMDTAGNLTIHPKFNASLDVRSKNDGKSFFDGSIRIDKEFSLLKMIYTVLAVVAAFAAAAVIVNAIFSAFDCRKKKKKNCKKNADPEVTEA